jgi:transposase
VTVLRQFLSRREAEILEQMKVLERELAEIRAAWAALQAEGGVPPPKQSPTIKDMVRQILRGRPDGLRAKELLKEIQERFGVTIERTSLSPQLSRLRESEEITLENSRWYSLQIPMEELKPPQGKRTPEPHEVKFDDFS